MMVKQVVLSNFMLCYAAVNIGLFKPLVLSTLPNPTMVLVMPEIVPVNAGLVRFTLPNPTIAVVIPGAAPRSVSQSVSHNQSVS